MTLTVNHIGKSFGTKRVLSDVSFQLQTGKLAGFIGRNGAGKTTTFRILSGISTVESGEIWFDGKQIDTAQKVWKARVGFLAEHNPLYGFMYVRQFLHHISRIGGNTLNKNRMDYVLDITGLNGYEKHKINQLSKGYKQRVGIAQAIMHDPEVLILDEPTTGLDPVQIVEIRELIKQLSADRYTILSSHILSEIQDICAQVIIVDQGRVVLDRPIYEIINQGQSYFVRVDRKYKIQNFESLGEQSKIGESSFEIKLKNDLTSSSIFDQAVLDGLKILELTPIQQSLEKEFMSIHN